MTLKSYGTLHTSKLWVSCVLHAAFLVWQTKTDIPIDIIGKHTVVAFLVRYLSRVLFFTGAKCGKNSTTHAMFFATEQCESSLRQLKL